MLTAALLAGCGGSGSRGPARASGAPSALSAACPRKVRLVVQERESVGAGAGPLAVEGSTAWVARPQAGDIVRVEGSARSVAQLGGAPISLAAAAGKLWVAERDGDRVVSLDGRTLQKDTTTEVPVPVSVVAGPLGVWALSIDTDSLYHLDASSGASAAPFDSPVLSPVEMVAAGEELWVLGAGEQGLSPFNAQLGRIVRAGFNRPHQSLSGLSASAGTIWLGEPSARSLLQVDAGTAAVRRLAAPDGISPTATATGACGLWLADASGDLALVDASTAAPLGPAIHVGRSVAALAASGTGVWVTDPLDGTLLHVTAEAANA
jgi:streptogramin lyase